MGGGHNEVLFFLEEGPFPVFQSANAVPDPLHGCSHKRWIDGRQVLPEQTKPLLTLELLGFYPTDLVLNCC